MYQNYLACLNYFTSVSFFTDKASSPSNIRCIAQRFIGRKVRRCDSEEREPAVTWRRRVLAPVVFIAAHHGAWCPPVRGLSRPGKPTTNPKSYSGFWSQNARERQKVYIWKCSFREISYLRCFNTLILRSGTLVLGESAVCGLHGSFRTREYIFRFVFNDIYTGCSKKEMFKIKCSVRS